MRLEMDRLFTRRVRRRGTLGLLALAMAYPAPAAAQRVMYPPPYPSGYQYRYAGPESNVRLAVTPKEAAVYVDGYFAGQVDQYDGVFQRLHLTPGEHDIVVYLAGYHSLHEQLYLSPNETRKISAKLEHLAAGEPNDPVPVPAALPPDEAGQAPPARPMPVPRRGPAGPYPAPYPPPDRGQASSGGTVAIRVQPAGAEILIDGERWAAPDREDERLLVQLADGRHKIQVRRSGYRDFSTEVDVRRGETVPVNISLTPDR